MNSLSLFSTSFTTADDIKKISTLNKEPEWLYSRRLDGFNEFQHLPMDKDTLFYKYTNFRKFDPSNLTPAWRNEDIVKVSKLADYHIVQNENSIYINLPDTMNDLGIQFKTLNVFQKENPEIAKKIISELDGVAEDFDKLGSLSRAFAINPVILYIPKNIQVRDTLKISTTISSQLGVNFQEFLIYVDDGSSISILELFSNENGNNESLYIASNSIILKDNSRLKYQQIQNWQQKVVHVVARRAKIGKYSSIIALTHLQGSQMTRHNSLVELDGQGSEGYDLFVKFGSERQRFDVKSELKHHGIDTIGQTHARSVMMDRSESILRGLITINETAVNADSWLTSKGMTVGKAKISAIPSLAILQNDVKAAHAASVEPLNENTIFYLETRGINEVTAKEMLVKGYFEYVLHLLKDEDMANLSRSYLNAKWDITN